MVRRLLAGLLATGMGAAGVVGLTAPPAAAAEVEFGSCATQTSTDCIVGFRFKPNGGEWTTAQAFGSFNPSSWPRQVWQTPGLFHEAQPLRIPDAAASFAPSDFIASVANGASVAAGATLGTVSYGDGRVSRTVLAPSAGTVTLPPAPGDPLAVGQLLLTVGTQQVVVPAWVTPPSGWQLAWEGGIGQGASLLPGQVTIGNATVTSAGVRYRADFSATGPARIDRLEATGTFEAGAQVATISSDHITFDARYDVSVPWGSFMQVQPQALVTTDGQALAWPGVRKCGPGNTLSWSPEDDQSIYDEQCYRAATLNPDALYEVTVRTSQVIPMFAAGRMSDMEATMSPAAAVPGSYDLTFRGGLRDVQFIAKSYEETDTIDGVMRDWSVYFEGAPPTPCRGEGITSGASNGFGTPQPTVDGEVRIVLETSGRHLGTDGNPYVGSSEMVIPDALAACVWNADLGSLASIIGAVEKDGVAQAATVTVTRRSGFTYIEASGYTYSSPTLVAQLPAPAVPAPAPGSAPVSDQPAAQASAPPAAVAPVSVVNPTTTATASARPVAAGLFVVPASLSGPIRVMARPPAAAMARAPIVASVAGRPVSLVATGLTPGDALPVRIRVGMRYVDLGTAVVGADGRAQLPAFRLTRPGTYRLALIDPTSGRASYIKVVVSKAKSRA